MDFSDEQENEFEAATTKNELYQKTFSTKDFLLIEVERFAVSIKHFYNIGILCKEDYEYLRLTLKMMGSFLASKFETNERFKQRFTLELQEKLKKAKLIKTNTTPMTTSQLSLFDTSKPIPITGEIAVTGLNENLRALRDRNKEQSMNKFPFKIPSGTKWENIFIKFIDDLKVEILVKGLRHIADFKELGLIGKGKIPEPSEQWYFLKVLSQCNGEITISDTQAKDKYKKQKQILSEILQQYFSIDYDPFYPYQSSSEKRGNSYKIKITLIPPPQKNDNDYEKIDNQDNDLGITEYLEDAAPQIYDGS